MFDQLAGSSTNFVSFKDKLHGVYPKPNHIYFTKEWPGNKWNVGKFFEIVDTKIIDYVRSYTLPENDYKEIDISNATNGLNLYPETDGQVHEILIGFKPGNYIIQIDVPNGSPLGTLPQSSMIPSKTDATLKYLNAKNPEDSPAFNPNIKLWAVRDQDAVILRLIILSGAAYEKATVVFKIARHKLAEIPRPDTAYETITHIRQDRSW